MNGEYRDETPLGKLMNDFFSTQAKDMNYKILANRVRFFKETEEGRQIMCKAMEDMVNEANKQKTLQLVSNLMQTMDITLEKAMDALLISQEDREYIIEASKKNI